MDRAFVILMLIHSAVGPNMDLLKNLTPFRGVKPRQVLREGDPGSTTAANLNKDCICSKIYDPVCGSNDKSYYNPCHFDCDAGKQPNVTILHQGNCIPF